MVIMSRVDQTVSWKCEDLFVDRVVQGLSTAWGGKAQKSVDQKDTRGSLILPQEKGGGS